mmetsp:Transcript_43594/g.51058  ORF Transcript_43594/g.51058 Transcript_43594/m.51058 type:complete len:80 (-) Transcript_43594:82-321(-)
MGMYLKPRGNSRSLLSVPPKHQDRFPVLYVIVPHGGTSSPLYLILGEIPPRPKTASQHLKPPTFRLSLSSSKPHDAIIR